MKSFSLALVLILGLALTGCGWNPFHKMYSATAVIQIRPRGVLDVPGLTYDSHEPDLTGRVEAEFEIIRSSGILTPVIQKLKLDQIWAKRLKADHAVLSSQEALNHFHEVLKIERVPGTNLVKTTASSEVPQEAADIANAVVDNYKASRERADAERYGADLNSIQNQIIQQQKVVVDKKAVMAKAQDNADAHRELEQYQSLLDALNVRLRQVIANHQALGDSIRIISRAVAPPE